MYGMILKVGDVVSITIPKENRDWGYNPCPDGTIGEVVGFTEIHEGRLGNYGYVPGVYENTSWVKLKLDKGRELTEFDGRLTLVDEEKAFKRKVKFVNNPEPRRKRLRDLPETPIWEGDEIKVIRPDYTDHYGFKYVVRIDYHYMDEKVSDGSPWPIYVVSPDLKGGVTSSFAANDLYLVQRGNVWKYYHNEPMEFNSLLEEADLAQQMGLTKEVRNPKDNLYRWDGFDELKNAIISGLGDSISMSGLFFGSGARGNLIKFNDRNLGERMRDEFCRVNNCTKE